MQLDASDRQNEQAAGGSHQDDNLECEETLSLPLAYHEENRLKSCGCRCSCLRENHPEDPLVKRRQKRKQSKRRQKERQKQLREKSLLNLQTIIREIYGLKTTFKQMQPEIRNCLAVESSRDRLCSFINMVIREEIDLVRRQIVTAVASLDHIAAGQERTAVAAVFHPIQKIALASLEVEKLINLFVISYSEEDEEEPPMQRNLDRTTLKFLVKTDLHRTGNFNRLCAFIQQSPPEIYLRQRELIKLMTFSYEGDKEQPELASSESEEDTEEYVDYEDEEWEEEVSTVESVKNSANQRSRRRRKERRRKLREDFESSYESIIKRMEEMTVVEQDRSSCNVSQQWMEAMRRRRSRYGAAKE